MVEAGPDFSGIGLFFIISIFQFLFVILLGYIGFFFFKKGKKQWNIHKIDAIMFYFISFVLFFTTVLVFYRTWINFSSEF